jgi:hypothetical protein
MYTLEQLAKKLPVRIVEKGNAQIHPSVLAAQLNLNGWLDEDLIDTVLMGARECVVTVFSTDYGPEARISGQVGRYPEERTELPGFTTAQSIAEVTIEKELERAAEYIGRKYAPRLGALKNKPLTYVLEKVSPNEPAKNAVIKISSELAPVDTEQDYWHFIAHGLVSKDRGRAVMRLAEANQHHKISAGFVHTSEEAWARTIPITRIKTLNTILTCFTVLTISPFTQTRE